MTNDALEALRDFREFLEFAAKGSGWFRDRYYCLQIIPDQRSVRDREIEYMRERLRKILLQAFKKGKK